MAQLIDLSMSAAIAKLKAGEITSVQLTQAYLDQIAQYDEQVKAYITVTGEQALQAAQAADDARANGEDKPLLGVPLAIKDVLSTQGIETTCASKILKGYIPIFDATCIANLKEAGALILGKLNMDEFAMGSSTENSGFFTTRNPWNLDYVPGGSSGGSAAVIAARMAAGALGTDTGGSIRLPGSFCNIVALKPSYGRVSRYGLIAYGSSLDCPGPMTQTVEDAARLLQAMAGHDPHDATSRPEPVPDYPAALTGDVKGLKIGIADDFFMEGLNPEVEALVRAAIDSLQAQGAEIVPVALPNIKYSLSTYYIIATSEASANLARFDGIRYGARKDKGDMWDSYRATRGEGFGEEVKRRIMLGTYALSAGYYDAWYGKAQQVRTLIKHDFDAAFEKCDVIAAPVSPTPAFKIGENISNPLQMYLMDVMTISANLAGICGISVPCGFTEAGLPVGLQLLGNQLDEATILRAAHAYEQTNPLHERKPALITA